MKNSKQTTVYEVDKGWSFDGAYVPHHLELNWYFGDSPVDYGTIQKIRVHGLAKGRAGLTVATNSMTADFLDYEEFYTEPQIIDIPRNPATITEEYHPVTNYVDVANRGISVQMKFEGRPNEYIQPEPSHVIQALVLQATPAGTGARSN